MVSLAVFGAEASDMDGVRAIRERREMDASARPRALLPTPSDGFHDTDARLPTPRGDREVQPKNMQPFPGYQREPQSHLGPSAPQYQEPNDANSKYPLQQNFQKPFNERNFRSREQDESQFRRDRVEPPSKRFPLLPTPAPNLSGEARDEQQQHAGRFPDDGFSRSHPRFGVQDNQREWHGNRRTLRSPDYLDAGQRDTDGNASRPGDAGSDHEALSNYPLEQVGSSCAASLGLHENCCIKKKVCIKIVHWVDRLRFFPLSSTSLQVLSLPLPRTRSCGFIY